MGNWNGLTYNNGLARGAFADWLNIDRLNLGEPEILEVNNGQVAVPTQSFIQLERGTVPNISQCHSIGTSGIAGGVILIVKGLSAESISMLSSVGNLDLDPSAFSLTSYSTMVLMRNAGWQELARSDNN
jgi:hypothetical protein